MISPRSTIAFASADGIARLSMSSSSSGLCVEPGAGGPAAGPDRVREIGSHYRAATPTENTAEALRTAISKSRGFHVPFLGNDSDDQIQDDFEKGRTAVVAGWVLSVTEARQAALFSLAPA